MAHGSSNGGCDAWHYVEVRPMRRVPLIIAIVSLFSGCTTSLVAPEINTSPPAVFEELWHEFNLRYAVFAERHVNWDSLHARYAARITPGTSDSTLMQLMDSLLAPLRDGHVSIGSRHGEYGYIHSDSASLIGPTRVSSDYLGETAEASPDGDILYGTIFDTIGYMCIKSLQVHDMPRWEKEIDDVLARLWNTKSLVIDLRNDEGGVANAVASLGARFFPANQIVAYEQDRYDADKTHLSDPKPVFTTAPRGDRWTKPLIVLTNRHTMSAAEWCTMAAKRLPNVTVIGDTTQGAFSARLARELSNGWWYSLSFMRVSDVNHVCHEGIGIIPDIEVYV